MDTRVLVACLIIMPTLLTGCNSAIPARMEAYLGPAATRGVQESASVTFPSTPLDAALLVLNDTTAPDSAPPLSSSMLSLLTNRIQEQVKLNFPIRGVTVLEADRISPIGDVQQFAQLTKEHHVNYVVLAIFSSTEIEVPVYLGIAGGQEGGGLGRPTVPGYRVENYALVELALLDTQSGRALIQAQGQAYSTLEKLDVPITPNNIYPVVRRALMNPPIYPDPEHADDTLRGVAGDDALKQALMHLKEEWTRAFRT